LQLANFWGFFHSCEARKGAFLPRFGVVLFHFATGGKGGFFFVPISAQLVFSSG